VLLALFASSQLIVCLDMYSEDCWTLDDIAFREKRPNFLVENLSGDPAFKITVMVISGMIQMNILVGARFYQAGPIRKQSGSAGKYQRVLAKITAEIFNTWEYDK